MTQRDFGKKPGVSLATVKRIMSGLQKGGKIPRKGSSRSGSWIIADQKE